MQCSVFLGSSLSVLHHKLQTDNYKVSMPAGRSDWEQRLDWRLNEETAERNQRFLINKKNYDEFDRLMTWDLGSDVANRTILNVHSRKYQGPVDQCPGMG
jgi:hypothetical protein